MSRVFTTSVVLILILCLPVIYPFLQKGFSPTHDGEWAVVRLAEMHREIKGMQFPPRWSGYLNHGYGYPLFLFTYPFPYYIAELLHLGGLSLVAAIKSVFIISVIGSALTMYYLGKRLWGVEGGWLSAVAYLYAPYRLVNLFVRGSIGESLAFVFYPLLLWLVHKFKDKHSSWLVVSTALTLATFLLTHNASVVLFAPVLGVWILFIWPSLEKKAKINLILSIVFGLVVSAHFWLPAILEKKFIALNMIPLADRFSNFVSLKELFWSNWHFGTRPPLILGLGLTVLVLVSGMFLLRKKNLKARKLGLILFGLVTFSFFMLFSISNLFWELPLLREIDFPWRMLSVVSFLLALLSGSLALRVKSNFALGLIALVLTGFSISYIQTQPSIVKSDDYYATNDATTTSADELMPIWVKIKPTNREDLIFRPQTLSAKVLVQKETSTEIDMIVDTVGTALILNKVYFPGWVAYLDEQKVQIETLNQIGLMSIPVPFGSHRVNFNFTRTPIRVIADMLSISGLITLLLYLWKNSSKLRS